MGRSDELERSLNTVKSLSKKRWFVIGGLVLVIFYGILQVMIRTIPLPTEGFMRPSSTLVFDENGQLLRAFTSQDEMWRIQTSLEEISPELRRFLITYEDRWFYKHGGINLLAICRAFLQNLRNGRVISGGSTITMQIARMMRPKERTLKNKIIEAFRALQLEYYYSKDQLLEIYFNIAPYGGNIEGAAAASWLYFGKEPTQLSYAEAALLAAIPNSPPYLRPDRFPEAAKRARDRVLRIMVKSGQISDLDYQGASKEPVPNKRHPWPFIAPHLSRKLFLENPDKARIYSTLDKKSQLIAEDLLFKRLAILEHDEITNGAVVVIDNQTRELKVMVGSRDFFNQRDSGQVNGALAPRSPGSTLKPFIYALGISQGVISPASYLEDVPIDYSGYTPENYDHSFSGIVSASEALERSLNIPAVNLTAKLLNRQSLYDLLKKAEISTAKAENTYGLSLALGNFEITLAELTNLYVAFANQGRYSAYRELLDVKNLPEVELFDGGTSFIITDILTNLRRPDLPAVWEFSTLPKVAWKTGTSYGHRDAWSIGYNPLYTIGVWLGNFDGQGAAALVGANAAAPLLFDLFTELSRGKQINWFPRPEGVEIRHVCSLSGQLATEYCDSLVEEYYLVDKSPREKCTFHQSVMIDLETGYRLPNNFTPKKNIKKVNYIQWPPRIATWMRQNGYQVYQLPPLSSKYQQQIVGQAPIINSPAKNVIYYLRPGVAVEYQKIVFQASVSNDVSKIYWFIDGQIVGSVKPGEKLFYIPEVGEHQLICQDDLGRMSKIKLVIKRED